MGTHQFSEAPEPPHSLYIDELREFFSTSGVLFGSPDDIFALADHLREPGSFSDDLASLIRSIVLREGGAMPHAHLLEILSLAIAGPEPAQAPERFREPLRQLLAFISGVMRRPWNVPPSEAESGEVVPFPTEARTSEPAAHAPVAVFQRIRDAQIRGEQVGEQVRESRSEPSSRVPASHGPELIDSVHDPVPQTASVAMGEDATPPQRWTPMRRNLLLGAAGATAVAAVLILALRPHQPKEVFHIGPAPTQSAIATPSPTAAVATSSDPASAKPSASGTAAQQQLNRRAKPAVSAWAYSPPINLDSLQSSPQQPAPRPQPADNSRPATAYSSPSPINPASSQDSLAPATSEAPAAPIVRRPSPRDADSTIVGDVSADQIDSLASTGTPHFNVSSGVMAAYLVSAPDPEYPALAHLAHVEGQVILQAVVAKDGSVSSVHALRGNRLLRGAAEDAVRHWQYRPYRVAGRPIDVATIITLDFHDRN